jgi:hypothetical protein
MFANSPDRQLRLDFGAPVPFRFGKLLICLILSVFLTHCGAARVQVYQYPQPDNFPRTVAILPFTFEKDISEPESPHAILRQTFFNYFSYLGYTDMPLEEVNTRLRKAGYKLHEATTMSVKELRDVLGVDAVIRGLSRGLPRAGRIGSRDAAAVVVPPDRSSQPIGSVVNVVCRMATLVDDPGGLPTGPVRKRA